MSRKNKNIPVPEPEKEEYECPSASWSDMTGLIPYAAETPDDRSSYGEVYPYLPEYGGNMGNNNKNLHE